MTEWVLIMTMAYNGVAINSIKLPDKGSCYRVGTRFIAETSNHYYPKFICTEVKRAQND
jgi:hypothetical protein